MFMSTHGKYGKLGKKEPRHYIRRSLRDLYGRLFKKLQIF